MDELRTKSMYTEMATIIFTLKTLVNTWNSLFLVLILAELFTKVGTISAKLRHQILISKFENNSSIP
jgi:hypothetical protein